MKRLLIFIFLINVFISCDSEPSQTTMTVRLVDAPADYDQVLIDVLDVEIHSDETGWQPMDEVESGIYNLLDFTNGMDTVLATSTLPPGRISQMRMVLGENNSVVMDEENHALQTPSSQQSGLKFLIQADLTAGIEYEMWIDFDAGKSIVVQGNGDYLLKPVIRTYTKATTGSIQGSICDVDSQVYINAIGQDGSEYGTYASEEGEYQINGLPEGTYQIVFSPNENFVGLTLDNISVNLGEITNIEEKCFDTADVQG